MSHEYFKTEYEIEGYMGGTDKEILYCEHFYSCDCVTMYNKIGEIQTMSFQHWSSRDNDLWNAAERLMFPYESDRKLRDGVTYWTHEERIKMGIS